jgi:hypothetical protein
MAPASPRCPAKRSALTPGIPEELSHPTPAIRTVSYTHSNERTGQRSQIWSRPGSQAGQKCISRSSPLSQIAYEAIPYPKRPQMVDSQASSTAIGSPLDSCRVVNCLRIIAMWMPRRRYIRQTPTHIAPATGRALPGSVLERATDQTCNRFIIVERGDRTSKIDRSSFVFEIGTTLYGSPDAQVSENAQALAPGRTQIACGQAERDTRELTEWRLCAYPSKSEVRPPRARLHGQTCRECHVPSSVPIFSFHVTQSKEKEGFRTGSAHQVHRKRFHAASLMRNLHTATQTGTPISVPEKQRASMTGPMAKSETRSVLWPSSGQRQFRGPPPLPA